MEGDRKITLLEPAELAPNEYGEVLPGEPIEHVAWAVRRDRGGGESLTADTTVGAWETSFRARRSGLEHISQTWALKDDGGAVWDIERISEVPAPPRRWWMIYCVKRGAA